MARPPLGRFRSPILGMQWDRTLDEGAPTLAGASEADVAKASARPDRTALAMSAYRPPGRMVDLILRKRGLALAQADAPGAAAVPTPAPDIDPPARSTARRRHGCHVAAGPAAAVPSLLEPALDAARAVVAQAALADPRGWSSSARANVR